MIAKPLVWYDTEKCQWVLGKRWIYRARTYTIIIPEGFRFDLASIPRPLWWLISPNELSVAAALLHDFIYQHRGDLGEACVPLHCFSRKDADLLLLEIMRKEHVWWWRRALAYPAVRLFGWLPWSLY
jgi:hypothetical protein